MCHQNGNHIISSRFNIQKAICPSVTLEFQWITFVAIRTWISINVTHAENWFPSRKFQWIILHLPNTQCPVCLFIIIRLLFLSATKRWSCDLSECPAAEPSSSPCVLPDQHHDTAAVRAADPEAQPAHPPQPGPAQPGGEELPGEQAAGGAGAPGERAAPRCRVRTDLRPTFHSAKIKALREKLLRWK